MNNQYRFRTTALFFLFFFLIIAAYWTLKPLRTSSVVNAFGPDYYLLFKQVPVFLSPVLVAVLTYTSCFYTRERIIYIFTSIFFVLGGCFWALFEWYGGAVTKIAFFFFVDIYITMMVVLFFSYMNDYYNAQNATKYYSYIGLGGLVGGIVGSSIAGWLGHTLGNYVILMFSTFLIPIFFIVAHLRKLSGSTTQEPVCPGKGQSYMMQMTEGVKMVFASRYLLAILAIVGIYEIVSTSVDYQFNATLAATFSERDAMAAYQGKVFFFAQFAALGVQLLLTTFIHRKCGIICGLLFLPGILLLGSTAFIMAPTLLLITLTIGGEASCAYSINQVSKEILYVPLDPVSKYKSKAFIDIIGVRFAKAIGAAVILIYTLWLRKMGLPSTVLMGMNIILIGIWLYAINVVRLGFAEKKNRNIREESTPANG